ncbi:MAG: hypothetical protein JW793_11235 [Acidobacteria bacterium]|nr:hypothetical protein [Acidobacteriota bacterium]
MTDASNLLRGRCLFLPDMSPSSTRVFVAALASAGIEASGVPPSDGRTLELSGGHISGDECFPLRVVLGDFLKVIEAHGEDRVAFFLPTTCGPCRFGQYSHFLRKVLGELGYGRVPVLSPSSANGYGGIGLGDTSLLRTIWRAIVASDLLQRMLLHIRPYEQKPGESDAVYSLCLEDLCRELSRSGIGDGTRLQRLAASLARSRDRLRAVPVFKKNLPVIGIVGEIFCRLNEFSNQDMIRRMESHGAECWLSGISEWLAYASMEHRKNLRIAGKRFSPAMGVARLKNWFQRRDERILQELFRGDLEDEADLEDVMEKSRPYLPHQGVIGEMVLNVGKAVYLWEKGVSGIIDISPFSCMNGVVCQAVYPRVGDEHDGIPIRVFFFDQSRKDLDQDIAVFMELVGAYRARNKRS